MFLRFNLLSIAIFFLYGCKSHTTTIYPASKVYAYPYKVAKLNQTKINKYISAINKMRTKSRHCGTKFYPATKPLIWNDALYKASYEHSKDMASSNSFTHNGSAKQSDWTAKKQKLRKFSTMVNRIENNGYGKYKSLAENIAYGIKSGDKVIHELINSSGHCKNIMNPDFRDFGMAKATSKDGIVYWTQDFGTR